MFRVAGVLDAGPKTEIEYIRFFAMAAQRARTFPNCQVCAREREYVRLNYYYYLLDLRWT